VYVYRISSIVEKKDSLFHFISENILGKKIISINYSMILYQERANFVTTKKQLLFSGLPYLQHTAERKILSNLANRGLSQPVYR